MASTPTVIPPKLYSDRFMQAMKHYFLKVSCDWLIDSIIWFNLNVLTILRIASSLYILISCRWVTLPHGQPHRQRLRGSETEFGHAQHFRMLPNHHSWSVSHSKIFWYKLQPIANLDKIHIWVGTKEEQKGTESWRSTAVTEHA
jgi:hypothetical protein